MKRKLKLLKVVLIFNKFDPERKIEKIRETIKIPKSIYAITLSYKMNEIIECRYTDYGIKYHPIYCYTNILPALLSELDPIKDNYSGSWIEWFENIKIREKGQYLNGLKTGHWIKYFDDGDLYSEQDIIFFL